MAPVCSSWTFLNRGTSGRHRSMPLGRFCLHEYVREANVMVSRCTLLAWAALAVGAFYCLEQPAGSLLQYHPRWQQLIAATQVTFAPADLFDFVGRTSMASQVQALQGENLRFRCMHQVLLRFQTCSCEAAHCPADEIGQICMHQGLSCIFLHA